MPRPGIVALADDATGALEVGAQFARDLIASEVSFRADPLAFPDTTAVVVDTATRHLGPQTARAIVTSWVTAARRQRIELLYKKTDSTLRGNIAAELGAMLDAWPDAPLVYVPAYPALERRVRAARLYLGETPLSQTHFARDLRNPVSEDRILALLEAEIACPARSVTPDEVEEQLSHGGRAVLVCDSESDADLETIADALGRCRRPYMVAGTGAFAGIWARRLRIPREHRARPLAGLPCLVINGSRHPASLEQVRRAGIAVEPLETSPASRLTAVVRTTGWGALNPPEAITDDPDAIARRLAAVARSVAPAAGVRTLIIFGGDTTRTVLEELGVTSVQPLGEVQTGVPVSSFTWQDRQMGLITKAGGFGGPDALAGIRRILEKET